MVALCILITLLSQCLASAEYSEPTAVTNLFLAVSSYCGQPKFNASFLQTWECGPACAGAGSVTEVDLFQDTSLGIFGVTGHFDSHCVVIFRGTSSSDGWKTDLDATLVDLDWAACAGGCQIESGFSKGYLAVRSTIASQLSRYGCKDLRITGHSLGAALATIAGYDLASNYSILQVYNFGSPRVGNQAFASNYDTKFSDHWRVTHYKDPIPHGPTLGMGFNHIGNEVYYHNTTAEGYRICPTANNKSCADQWGGNLIADIILASCCADDHLEYMQNSVNIATDGDSCTHVAMDNAAQHAYLTTASYCQPEEVRQWDCGEPCERVKGGVQNVQILDVPFQSRTQANQTITGVVRGFVGHMQSDVGNRCILSLRNLFSDAEGLAIIKDAVGTDMEDILRKDCKDCKILKVVLDAYRAVKDDLLHALQRIGCTSTAHNTTNRRLIVVGHGLGSSLGAFIAFQLKNGTGYKHGGFGVEFGFQFGAPRTGNSEFVKAFHHELGGDIFRVTHSRDPYVQFPLHENGFVHMNQELFFQGDASWDPASYTRCPTDGEDQRCAQRYRNHPGPLTDHTEYLRPLVDVEMNANACKQNIQAAIV